MSERKSIPPRPKPIVDITLTGQYVDDFYSDALDRVDVKCPYCGGLHSTLKRIEFWACRDCGNDFQIPFLARLWITFNKQPFMGNMPKRKSKMGKD